MISVKTWLERFSKVSFVSSSVGVVSGVLVDLMFFWVCFMCPFVVALECSRCFIRYTVMFVHVEKWNFLMAWSKFFEQD